MPISVVVPSTSCFHRSVVAADCASPWLVTVTPTRKLPPVTMLSVASIPITTKSGTGSDTVTATDEEQLLVVSDSPATESTHAQ